MALTLSHIPSFLPIVL